MANVIAAAALLASLIQFGLTWRFRRLRYWVAWRALLDNSEVPAQFLQRLTTSLDGRVLSISNLVVAKIVIKNCGTAAITRADYYSTDPIRFIVSGTATILAGFIDNPQVGSPELCSSGKEVTLPPAELNKRDRYTLSLLIADSKNRIRGAGKAKEAELREHRPLFRSPGIVAGVVCLVVAALLWTRGQSYQGNAVISDVTTRELRFIDDESRPIWLDWVVALANSGRESEAEQFIGRLADDQKNSPGEFVSYVAAALVSRGQPEDLERAARLIDNMGSITKINSNLIANKIAAYRSAVKALLVRNEESAKKFVKLEGAEISKEFGRDSYEYDLKQHIENLAALRDRDGISKEIKRATGSPEFVSSLWAEAAVEGDSDAWSKAYETASKIRRGRRLRC